MDTNRILITWSSLMNENSFLLFLLILISVRWHIGCETVHLILVSYLFRRVSLCFRFSLSLIQVIINFVLNEQFIPFQSNWIIQIRSVPNRLHNEPYNFLFTSSGVLFNERLTDEETTRTRTRTRQRERDRQRKNETKTVKPQISVDSVDSVDFALAL